MRKKLRLPYRWTTLLGRVVIGNRKLLKAAVLLLLLLLRFAKLWSKLASRPAPAAAAAPALQCDKTPRTTKKIRTMINVECKLVCGCAAWFFRPEIHTEMRLRRHPNCPNWTNRHPAPTSWVADDYSPDQKTFVAF